MLNSDLKFKRLKKYLESGKYCDEEDARAILEECAESQDKLDFWTSILNFRLGKSSKLPSKFNEMFIEFLESGDAFTEDYT